MNKKRITLIILLLIAIGLVLLLLVFKREPTPESQLFVPTGAPISFPAITTFFKSDKNLRIKMNVDRFDTPEKLPLITITAPKSFEEQDVIRIAVEAGLKSDFNKFINGEKQRIYTFRGENSYLNINADTGEISYKSYENISDANKKLSDNEIVSISKKFLSQKFSFNEDLLSLSFIKHFENEDYVNPGSTNQPSGYFEVNFAPALTDYKILTTDPEQSPIKVFVSDDGTIGKAEITLVYQAQTSNDLYPIKNFDDIKNQIDSAKIVKAYTEELHGQTFPPDKIESIVINKIEIVYYGDPSIKTKFYQPVFLLEGIGSAQNLDKPIRVFLYLQATKTQVLN